MDSMSVLLLLSVPVEPGGFGGSLGSQYLRHSTKVKMMTASASTPSASIPSAIGYI